MNRIYLLAFNDYMGTQQSVLDFLDTRREITNWLSVLPHSVLLVSEHPMVVLRNMILAKFPNCFFLLSEIHGSTSNGLLSKAAWDFINNPKSSGRWDQ